MSVPARSAVSSNADSKVGIAAPTTMLERLRWLRQIVSAEGNAILAAASTLSADAVRAAEMTANCEGSVLVTGVGKAGLVGQKLVATLASTGTPAHFLHPAEAIHGDLGRVRSNDIVWALSNSGRSEEVVRIADHLAENSAGLIAITASDDNPLAVAADCVVSIGRYDEACPNGLAPTTSTAVMMAVGDAVAMLASSLRNFTSQDFARFHPGGSLGRKLATVNQIMRPIGSCRVASKDATIREAMIAKPSVDGVTSGRRTGAIMLIDRDGRMAGIFTDSDLARLLQCRDEASLDQPISTRMTTQAATIESGSMLREAMAVMSHRRISELPVIDKDSRPIGLIDITDVVSLSDSSSDAVKIIKF
ncbi:KpsF/GutQ family sugar-phosphate isomerase [Rubripirellula reticaptiva]|uniref:Arabinose 5-phosphate isomerase KpsF n=1 Tax=Rubripirellula reticaptiva TaxID=2528013 RepID=A0A5C6EN99_9BACT|nr:KpsF/GutQ family sugar-phosphate isomerase [Rubripirellula reticaptiva]TWU51213.1 Arabinose 5-phosphate isomerase KpsF [Rubripirellula reticaptiva]